MDNDNGFSSVGSKGKADIRAEDEARTKKQADLIKAHYLDSRNVEQKLPLVTGVLSNEEMHSLKVVTLSLVDRQLVFAITPRTSQKTAGRLRQRFKDYIVQFVMISPSGYKALMNRYDPPVEVEYQDISLSPEGENRDLISTISSTLETIKADDIFEYLVEQAVKLGASDLHIESIEQGARIRMRIDGVLHRAAQISGEKSRQLMSTVARLASIAIASPDPQTSHIYYAAKGAQDKINMRVETIMTTYGQDAVMRILNTNDSLESIDNLGLTDYQKASIAGVIDNPHGLVLVTGPTGSGKTTTLYSILRQIDNKQHKVITLEDPVENNIDGVIQIPVDTQNDQTFADMLRSVLRLDPDVVLVGEIRDADTARTALQAALTGHLVLSSFHASSASAALARMREMIGDNPLFSSAFKMIIAQRLLRTFPPEGRQLAPEGYSLRTTLDEFLGPGNESKELYIPKSTPELPFGYNGRRAVMEILKIDDNIKQLLNSTQTATTDQLQKAAIDGGMIDLKRAAVQLVLNADTSLDEVMRVIEW